MDEALKTKISLAAKTEAEYRETVLRDSKLKPYKENELLANYFGRLGGFYAGVEWLMEQIRLGNIKL